MKRLTISLRESHDAVARGITRASGESRDVPTIDSKSEILRHILDTGLEALLEDVGAEADLEDVLEAEDVTAEDLDVEELLAALLPKHAVVEYRREARKQETRPYFLASDTPGRFATTLDRLWGDSEVDRASPRKVEEIASSYRGELLDYLELGYLSQSEYEEQLASIDAEVERYRRDYEAATSAPSSREQRADAEIGRAVDRLAEQPEQVLEWLEHVVETCQGRPSEIRRGMASKFGVGEEVVEVVLEELTPEGLDQAALLKGTSDERFPSVEDLAEAGAALEERDDLEDELEAVEGEIEQLPNHPSDDGALQLRAVAEEDD